MKASHHPSAPPVAALLHAVACACLLICIPVANAIPLTGANGKTVEFAGIKSAGPKGLTVQLEKDGQVFDLGWEKLDLLKVRSAHPAIDAAYKEALGGKTTELNLGTFAPEKPAEKKPMTAADALIGSTQAAEALGSYEVNVRGGEGVGSAKFRVLIPSSGAPKGVLLVSRGADGLSIRYLPREREFGAWKSFQTDLNFAILSYDFHIQQGGDEPERPKAHPYIYPEKGSGDAVFAALEELGSKTGTNLSNLPIAVYGTDMLGAAFAYNFTQWKPERVIAAVVAKGGFYAAEPTEASVKVPLLMIWGEYNGEPEIWEATHTHSEIFGKYVNLKPNWVYAMEPRGQNDESPPVHFFGKTFLKEMIARRMDGAELAELDRSESWVGDIDELDVVGKIEDPAAVLPGNLTWLPDAEFAELWKQFNNGRMPLPQSETTPAPEPAFNNPEP